MEERESVKVRVEYTGVNDLPILFANHFAIQQHGDEVFLVVGQVSPPILLGSEEDQKVQARSLQAVPIKAVARLGMTVENFKHLVTLLHESLDRVERRGRGE